MSSSKITTLIYKRLLAIYLYFFLVSITAAFSLSAQASSAFPALFPPLDSPFEGIALTDATFASYLYEKPNKKWTEPYMFLPQRNDHFFVYPVTRGSHNDVTPPDQPEGETSPNASNSESVTSLNEPEEQPEGASAPDQSPYRSWLITQLQRTDLAFWRSPSVSTSSSDITDQEFTQDRNLFLTSIQIEDLQNYLRKYLESLPSQQRIQWFSQLLKAPPEIFQKVIMSLPPLLIEQTLPPLPQDLVKALEKANKLALTLPLLAILAFFHEQEPGISTEENQYYETLSSGNLPSQQPPQRSFILTLADFQNDEIFERMRTSEVLTLFGASRLDAPEEQASGSFENPEEAYLAYLTVFIALFFNKPDALLIAAKGLYTQAILSQHPLREQYGLFYVPSQSWLDHAVEAINNQVEGAPVGLEIAAGSGSLSHFLQGHYRIPMTATDNNSRYQGTIRNTGQTLRASVEQADAVDAVRTHPEANFLVLSWPDSPISPEPGLNPGYAEMREMVSSLRSALLNEPAQQDCPFLSAIREWNNRGPILFIGELGDHSRTGSQSLRNYLQEHFDAISFRDFYQSLPFTYDYPTLFVPKTKNKSDKTADKGKDANKSCPPPEPIEIIPIKKQSPAK